MTDESRETQKRRCTVDHVQVLPDASYAMVTVVGENGTTAEFKTLAHNSPRAGQRVVVEFSWLAS